MSLSSNSIFHYTSRLEVLVKILEEQVLRPSYCHEINGLNSSQNVWIPMVSFCDIPLSQSQNIQSYGSYAIGFTKDWALRKPINPVFYFNENSIVYKRYSELKRAFRDEISIGDDSFFKQLGPNGIHFLRYLLPDGEIPDFNILGNKTKEVLLDSTLNFHQNYKKVEGPLKRGEVIIHENYKFYDERELRYLPDIRKNDFENFPAVIFEKDWEAKYKTKLGVKPHFGTESSYNLPFSFQNIDHLIVQSDLEIPELIKYLRTLKGIELDTLVSARPSTYFSG